MRLPFLHALRKKFGYLVARRAARAARECVLSEHPKPKLQKKKRLFQPQRLLGTRRHAERSGLVPGAEKTRLVGKDRSPIPID